MSTRPSGPIVNRVRALRHVVARAAERTGAAGTALADRRRAAAFPDPFAPLVPPPGGARLCNICRWEGPAFEGIEHCESATCPRCGSIARDRFLFHCLQARPGPTDRPGGAPLRLLETSPRLGGAYRRAMARWFDYTCSDYDERAHAGMIHLDLQQLDLPDGGLDVILSPHVLEHVPDTGRALSELHRVLAPGGRLYLQVPVLQGRTAPPATPEFHGDDTPVFWRFGPELTDALEAAGFRVALLATAELAAAAGDGEPRWPLPPSPEFDVDQLLAALTPARLTEVASTAEASALGFRPAYMFLTWEAVRPT